MTAARIRFRVLGTTEVSVDGVALPLRAKRLRALLTALLVEPNRVVAPESLIEALWAGEPPAGPERALHTAVSRLRTALGPAAEVIRTVPGGYLIELAPDQLDLTEFGALLEQADMLSDVGERKRILTQALELWQEVPLTGDSAAESLQGRPWLVLERLRAMEQLVDVRLALGEHAAVIAELTVLTREHPLRERLWVHLMLALYRSGRQADALAAYRELTAVLAEELGVEPAAEVRALHQSILRGDVPAADQGRQPAPEPEPAASEGWRAHWQLPADLSDFVGRENLIHDLRSRLRDSAAMPIVVVSGPPGVGKSALATHLGHRLREQFPDGHWHVRLAGASGAPREPFDVLGELLGLTGIDAYELPANLDARSALLRSTLADRRVLLVLDDARDAAQVRPLLPGTAGNAVLVTSRNDLTGLSVTVGARGARLAMLEPVESTDLLIGMLGRERIVGEQAAALELAKLCDHLPLALRIAAGLLAAQPDKSVAEYAEELRTGDRLAALAIGDEPGTAVEVAFSLSYEALPPLPRRLFALLGVVPGSDLTAPAAAALLGCPPREVGPLLDRLVSVNLLQRERSRYRMHDLIRLYAEGRAAVEPEADEAWRRLLDWYLRTADAAIDFKYRSHVRLTGRLFNENPFADQNQADSWLQAEESNLIACVLRAADNGPYDAAWRLADVLRHYLARVDHFRPLQRMVEAGLRAALVAGDRAGEGAMRHALGVTHFTSGDNLAAIAEISAASELYAEVGFRLGEAGLLCNLGMAYDNVGDVTRAAGLLFRGIAIFRELGRVGSLAPALHSLSAVYYNLGDLDAAVAAADESWEVDPDPWSRHVSLINRGSAFRLLGDWAAAEADLTGALTMADHPSVAGYYELALLYADLERFEEAAEQAATGLEFSRRDGLEWFEAAALKTLAIARHGQGRLDQAERLHREAHEIAVRLTHRTTEAEALLGLAVIALTRDQPAEALELGGDALRIARELKTRVIEARILRLLAEASRANGSLGDAERLAGEEAAIKAETGYVAPARIG
ncbi:AfsR/SARP family transcriptional regulator [Kribbella sp. CA-293567]|uniref:AfsR/SARP family transcriptional regulator n=1 Tax=Kribbella sp. CA-293567 TaxID=3002436 RepID=UPI0022DDF7CF|nr:BTAD domain-containing putative transcriptional regulator [Kribbella sp. CA-293567]WBQ02447.1 BTAD domain-containing putative transcriptional regulator [Kribbella sp. CA-293567]